MHFLEFSLYADLPRAFWLIFIFFGAALGSFFNVLAIRWPATQINTNHLQAKAWVELNKGMVTGVLPTASLPLLAGRSHCPCCKQQIPIFRNIPLLSWLLLRGKSACCQRPISFVYLAMEIIGALVFAGVAFTVGPTVPGFIMGSIAMLLILMARIDAVEGFIPDALIFSTTALAYLFALSHLGVGADQAIITHILVFFGLYCVFQAIGWAIGSEAMGMADYHLLSISGVLLGYQIGWVFLALIPMLVLTLLAKSTLSWQPGVFAQLVNAKAVPAGPAIAASTLLVLSLKFLGLLP
jgi:prepilin signal peptidase PulO-like enzyme (type II secretory pathway)